jgi:hypothetical protein
MVACGGFRLVVATGGVTKDAAAELDTGKSSRTSSCSNSIIALYVVDYAVVSV